MPHTPLTEQDIEQRLSALHIEPSARLAERLQHAPWRATAPRQTAPTLRYNWAAAAATVLLALGLLMFTPLGTLAQAVLSHFFTPAASHTITRTYTVPVEPTPIASAPVYQPQTLNAAQAQVDFAILLPQVVPNGYAFVSADVYDGVVYLAYRMPDDIYGRNLVIKQMPVAAYDTWEVGADAAIQPVQVGAVSGEYVKGWWRLDSPPSEIDRNATETTHTASLVWDASLGMHLLHWQVGEFAYEILYQESGTIRSNYDTSDTAGYLTLNDLTAVAASLH